MLLHSTQMSYDDATALRALLRSTPDLIFFLGMIGSALVDINGRPCVLSSVVDITDRKRAENVRAVHELV